MTPCVSVLICTYNRADSLRDTLQALQDETASRVSYEIVVVDNNSADHTRRVVEEAAGTHLRPVHYLFEGRQGKSHALNLGVQESRGELIAFTDDDVIPQAGWVEALWQAAEQFQADAVGGRILPLWAEEPPAWLPGQLRLMESLALLDGGPEPVMNGIHTAYRIYGANMALRKIIFNDIGGFRTDLGPLGRSPTRGEETELLIRAHRAGKRLLYAPQAVVHHKVPAERMRLGYLRRAKFHGGRALVLGGELSSKPFPRWLVRQCGEHLLRSLWAYGTGRFAQGVGQEMSFWEQLGELAEILQPSHANGTRRA